MVKVANYFLIICLWSVSLVGFSQVKQITFENFISELEANTEYGFSYPDELKTMELDFPNTFSWNQPRQWMEMLETSGIKLTIKGDLLLFRKISETHNSVGRLITGYVRDHESGESLIGAHVIDAATGKGVSTNTYGYFSLQVTSNILLIGYVGYKTREYEVGENDDQLILLLQPASELLDEVVINGIEEIQDDLQMSAVKLTPQQIEAIPVFMGESDVLKTLQLLPGVQSGTEGSSGLYVRGGGPDQNLILLDGVPVYNANHLFGFFSVFNTDAINNVEIIKGGFPARFGGRLSSVIDIQMKEGNLNKLEGEGAIGLIASRFTLNGPISKGKTSFMISGRRTYMDLFTVPIAKMQNANEIIGYNFWDLNGKINHIFSNRDRVFLSFYAGRDNYKQIHQQNGIPGYKEYEESQLQWGNITSAFRWNHQFSPKLFSNLTTIYTRYRFNLNTSINYETFAPNEPATVFRENGYFSNIEDVGLKYDFNYYLNNNHEIRFGAGYLNHTITPGVSSYVSAIQADTTFGASKINMDELYVYLEDNLNLTNTTQLNLGVHASSAMVNGKNYYSLQPRVSLNQKISNKLSIKASYSSMAQYIHLLVNSGIGLPTDLWVPSTEFVKPQLSEMVALGFATTRKGFEFSVEGYFKKMNNLIEYKDGAGFLDIVNDWEQKLEFGKGESKGVEFLLRKQTGRATGWIGYTWSKTNRTFENINQGKSFPYRYDRRHDLSVVFNYKLNEKIDFGAVWVYGTGNSLTLPTSVLPKAVWTSTRRSYEGQIKGYEGRNASRMKDYHRLDLNVSFKKQKRWGERKWIFGLYNAYSRLNPAFIFFDEDPVDGKQGFKQISLFPVVPNVSYQFSF